jgi:hypothetical protein
VLAGLIVFGRRRINRWGATDDEAAGALAGDNNVPAPRLGYTRAVSIDARPEVVWPWLAQIGHDRGGLYSYDWLENLFGCDMHSATTILAEHQHLDVGMEVALGPEGYPSFEVQAVDPPHHLVLTAAEPAERATGAGQSPSNVQATWQWTLRAEGDGTRLIVRQRLSCPNAMLPMWLVVEPIGFVMEQKMLRGIKARAEQHLGSLS